MKSKISVEQADAKLILLDKEVIKADQDKIRGVVLNLDKSVHDNAVQCLMHAEKHGDTSLMRRLVIEVLGTKTTATGYRTQGLINWMRKHSPMELKGDVMNLSGVLDEAGIRELRKAYPELEKSEMNAGEKRPFLIAQANRVPFTRDMANAEKVWRPVFTETLISPVLRFAKTVDEAMQNTVNGKPVDVKKPFFDGIHADALKDAADRIKEIVASLPKDSTLEIRRAQARIADDAAFIKAHSTESASVETAEETKAA